MKKIFAIMLATSVLGGCVEFQTDLQEAQAERDALLLQKRMREGCAFVRDQDAYRECLLKTYYTTHPKGYQTAELVDGEPIAIISNARATSGGCRYEATQNQRTVTQVAPLPPIASAQIVPYSTSEVTTTDTTYTQDIVIPQATVVKTQEVIANIPVEQPVSVLPVEQPVVVPDPVPVVPVQQQNPTWWDNYQENRVAPAINQPKCPCDDPNDPCPQCYEK